MLAKETPPLLLAEVANDDIDPAPFLVSEKYDGVRAVWDGQRLRFRSGRPVPAPAWFTGGLPAAPLDGELWLARGRFDEVSGIVRQREPRDEQWRRLHYMVFEMPHGEGPFTQRAARIEQLASATAASPLRAVVQRRVADRAGLKALFDDVLAGGGEGVMLHRADAPYCTGRSQVLLKMKPLSDEEAKVVAHLPGKGKYAGMMGALVVQTHEGRRVRLGSGFTDELRRHPPPIGSTVTYAYRDRTPSGVPRFASFVRMADEF